MKGFRLASLWQILSDYVLVLHWSFTEHPVNSIMYLWKLKEKLNTKNVNTIKWETKVKIRKCYLPPLYRAPSSWYIFFASCFLLIGQGRTRKLVKDEGRWYNQSSSGMSRTFQFHWSLRGSKEAIRTGDHLRKFTFGAQIRCSLVNLRLFVHFYWIYIQHNSNEVKNGRQYRHHVFYTYFAQSGYYKDYVLLQDYGSFTQVWGNCWPQGCRYIRGHSARCYWLRHTSTWDVQHREGYFIEYQDRVRQKDKFPRGTGLSTGTSDRTLRMRWNTSFTSIWARWRFFYSNPKNIFSTNYLLKSPVFCV